MGYGRPRCSCTPAGPFPIPSECWLKAVCVLLLVTVVTVLTVGILVLSSPGPANSDDASQTTPTRAGARPSTSYVSDITVAPGSTTRNSFPADFVVYRLGWMARPPRHIEQLLVTPVTTVIVQHTAGVECATREDCSSEVRQIQDLSLDIQGWSDIVYNFLVGGDGLVYVGRGWDIVGAHTLTWNARTIGVAVIGTFTNATVPPAQQYALRHLLSWGVSLGKLTADYGVMGACQVRATGSPGMRFMEDLRTWPHWSSYTDVSNACSA